jgi:hypothetical protein
MPSEVQPQAIFSANVNHIRSPVPPGAPPRIVVTEDERLSTMVTRPGARC